MRYLPGPVEMGPPPAHPPERGKKKRVCACSDELTLAVIVLQLQKCSLHMEVMQLDREEEREGLGRAMSEGRQRKSKEGGPPRFYRGTPPSFYRALY